MSLPKEVQITDTSTGALDFNFMARRLQNTVVFFIFVSDQFHEVFIKYVPNIVTLTLK